ncbi:unnamed protein product [Natator depressus]
MFSAAAICCATVHIPVLLCRGDKGWRATFPPCRPLGGKELNQDSCPLPAFLHRMLEEGPGQAPPSFVSVTFHNDDNWGEEIASNGGVGKHRAPRVGVKKTTKKEGTIINSP